MGQGVLQTEVSGWQAAQKRRNVGSLWAYFFGPIDPSFYRRGTSRRGAQQGLLHHKAQDSDPDA